MKKILLNTGVVYEGGSSKTLILSSLKGDTIPKLIETKKAAIATLHNCFGHQQLKHFQRKEVQAWVANHNFFVLAAPALWTEHIAS